MLFIEPAENIQAVQFLGRVDTWRFERLYMKEHAKQEGMGTQHKCRVVDDFWDPEMIAETLNYM